MKDNVKMEFLYELFDASLPRLAPGDDDSTKQALDVILSARRKLTGEPSTIGFRTLDIGCGNGAQTIQLAKHIDGTILAVDNHQPYLDELQRRAEAEGVSDKIRPSLKDMFDLSAGDGPFDLIWSEGALYIMGFQEGLSACHSLLAPGGLLSVSELCWLRPNPPAKCREFFTSEYPPMTDIATNLAVIRNCGYEVLEYFVLPESAWLKSYYIPLEERLQWFSEKYTANPERIEMINSVRMEIEMYRMYGSYYGYVFYVMRPGRA